MNLVAGGVAFSLEDEGVYTCRISDENGVVQSLYIGVYSSETYQNAGVLGIVVCCNNLEISQMFGDQQIYKFSLGLKFV